MAKKPLERIEMLDLQVRLAGMDEMDTCFDPDTHPKPPKASDEPIRLEGESFDIMRDTPAADPL